MRSCLALALAASGKRFVLPHVERLLLDRDQDVRRHATYGLRDAVCDGASPAFARAAGRLLLDLLARHPEDDNFAIGQALEVIEPALLEAARTLVAKAATIDENLSFFGLRESAPPWGDYGQVLVHGIGWNTARSRRGRLQLERTGPFVPPITFPDTTGTIVVTAALRRDLVAQGFAGINFVPVDKRRIVLLRWEDWEKSDEPRRYPAGGEPENYVLRRKHRPEIASQMPDLFELLPARVPDREGGPVPRVDFLRLAGEPCPNVVSRRAMRWLRQQVGDWVAFAALSEPTLKRLRRRRP